MNRLSDRAYRLLRRELHRQPAETQSDRLCRRLLQERLDNLHQTSGTRLTEAELQQAVTEFVPDFDRQVIRRAAKANRPSRLWGAVAIGSCAVLGSAGFVYVANLPYPMIRQPVADEAPLLLLPSFMEMDYNYRQAIALVEQADQLVNQATSPADFQLGGEKVTQAQKHLDKLPVWFLGYYPRGYCSVFGCSWRFTYDEFKVARQEIARMDAKLFQERNAQTQLDETLVQLNLAREQHQQAQTPSEAQAAIALWQAAIDALNRIPETTLAGRSARAEAEVARRDLNAVAGTATRRGRSNNYIEASKNLGLQAAQLSQNPPHNQVVWQHVINLWQEAIARLEQVDVDNPGYNEAQAKLAEYKANLAQAEIRLANERQSVAALTEAQRLTAQWQAIAATTPQSPRLVSVLQTILNELDKVEPGTTASADAQELRQRAENALDRIGNASP